MVVNVKIITVVVSTRVFIYLNDLKMIVFKIVCEIVCRLIISPTITSFSAASGACPHTQFWKFVIRCFPKIVHDRRVRGLTSHTDKHTGALHETLNTVDLQQRRKGTIIL